MRRSCLSVVVAFVAFLTLVMPTEAGIGWCKTDPVVLIDGELADIFVSAPLTAPLVVTGPTQIVVTLPVGIDAAVVLTDLGFGHGERVTFRTSHALRVTSAGIPVRIAVYVPARDGTLPIQVEFAAGVLELLSPATARGTANQWIILSTHI